MPAVSGWYPDPTGRFEYRYHNDAHWTADVSTNGRRYVDPLPSPVAPTSGRPPAPARADDGNGFAIASLVCGIVAIVIAWAPFVGIAGFAAAIVGLALSIPALRRSGPTGRRRGAAIAGLVTSAVGIALGVLGIVFTVYLVGAIERFDDPGPYEASITSCEEQGTDVVATGEITNQSDRQRDYSVLVRLGPGGRDWVTVEDVAAGATGAFTARDSGSFSDGACRVEEVRGPVPFGLDPSIFEE